MAGHEEIAQPAISVRRQIAVLVQKHLSGRLDPGGCSPLLQGLLLVAPLSFQACLQKEPFLKPQWMRHEEITGLLLKNSCQ